MQDANIAFIGAGAIAQAHAFALAALPYYYSGMGKTNRVAVASATAESRLLFAERYGFGQAVETEALWENHDIDTVLILGPNESHYLHLQKALSMRNIRRIYLEKPLCATLDETNAISEMVSCMRQDAIVQTGYQFLQFAAIRKALRLWRNGQLGEPIHFQVRYLHNAYLSRDYRERRPSRLTPAPKGGALADLGSHVLSLVVAFLGGDLRVVAAKQSGSFDDVDPASDLCTTVLLEDGGSGAIGTLVASRISAGSGDFLELELWCTNGSLRYTTDQPDALEVCAGVNNNEWRMISCHSDFLPASQFPAQPAPAGWLRALIHAHYLFFGGNDEFAIIPDLRHALAVQRVIHDIVEYLTADDHPQQYRIGVQNKRGDEDG